VYLIEEIEEKSDVSQSYPDIADAMTNEYLEWRGKMATPMDRNK
jgi:hypothetical protein